VAERHQAGMKYDLGDNTSLKTITEVNMKLRMFRLTTAKFSTITNHDGGQINLSELKALSLCSLLHHPGGDILAPCLLPQASLSELATTVACVKRRKIGFSFSVTFTFRLRDFFYEK